MNTPDSRYVDLAFDLPLRQNFTYEVPPELSSRIQPGVRARAELGTSLKTGIILGPAALPPEGVVKPVLDIIDKAPVVSTDVLALCRWLAEYYYCSLGETLRAASGALWLNVPRTQVFPADECWHKSAAELKRLPKTAREILAALSAKGGTPQARLLETGGQRRTLAVLARLERDGWIERRQVARLVPIPADARIFGIVPGHPEDFSEEQLAATANIGVEGVSRKEFSRLIGIPARKLAELMRSAVVRWRPASASGVEIDRNGLTAPLTDEQQAAVSTIAGLRDGQHPKPALLFGITGSGKTRVYLELARRVIDSGRRVLVLVPEIALARSGAVLWEAVFPGKVALWHSAMKSSDRYWVQRKVAAGEYDIVLGARSAIFAPLDNLGLIVVDEEHAEAYKQSEPDPRYHARDAAVVRARQCGCLCVLGSATPSVESFQNTQEGKYLRVDLKYRVPGRNLPVVHLVDLAGPRATVESKTDAVFTDLLLDRLTETINGGRQAILFLNRRGHSTMVTCASCGWRLECPHCGITLTYHLADRSFRCHLCQFRKDAKTTCPNCGNQKFGFRGVGTQKIVEQLGELHPEWRVDRLDTDTVAGGSDPVEVFGRFGRGETDILVGTQMVAKGLDFARVGLVGVVWADRNLSFPDFRAEERTFQLVTQVAGRSGRGKRDGTVVVQTFNPEHQLIELAAAQDYPGFFAREIVSRRELHYPPFTRLVRLEFSSTAEEEAYQAARNAVSVLNSRLKEIPVRTRLLGPAPAPIMRVRRRYRWRLLLKTKSVTSLLKHLTPQLEQFELLCRKKKDLRLVVDVDPLDFL